MKSRFSYFLIAVALFGCGRQQQLKAKIFERKELKGNRLLIKYHYYVNNNNYIDSATLPNVIIGSDSIYIIIDPSYPGKSIPDIQP
ncbi:MAG TPA: hypothetical protein VLJ41_00880 [Segetibacter sp.]|nr:hypothetical protein [Segetibacter sp.]